LKVIIIIIIIRIKVYFTLIILATCFGSLHRSHLQVGVLFTYEGDIYVVGK